VANFAVVWLISRFGPRLPVGLAAFLAAAGMAVIASATSAAGLATGVFVAGAAAGFGVPAVRRHCRSAGAGSVTCHGVVNDQFRDRPIAVVQVALVEGRYINRVLL
jgi:hypothetical protein